MLLRCAADNIVSGYDPDGWLDVADDCIGHIDSRMFWRANDALSLVASIPDAYHRDNVIGALLEAAILVEEGALP
jgi:hypothetical protein